MPEEYPITGAIELSDLSIEHTKVIPPIYMASLYEILQQHTDHVDSRPGTVVFESFDYDREGFRLPTFTLMMDRAFAYNTEHHANYLNLRPDYEFECYRLEPLPVIVANEVEEFVEPPTAVPPPEPPPEPLPIPSLSQASIVSVDLPDMEPMECSLTDNQRRVMDYLYGVEQQEADDTTAPAPELFTGAVRHPGIPITPRPPLRRVDNATIQAYTADLAKLAYTADPDLVKLEARVLGQLMGEVISDTADMPDFYAAMMGILKPTDT